MAEQPPGSGPAVPRDMMVPITLPRVIAGFRFARVADGADADNRPVVSAERGWIEDPDERRPILDYLRAGAVVMMVGGLGLDVFEPGRGRVVPMGTRTDGEWVWSDAVPYYLEQHGVAPEPELYRRILDHLYRCPDVRPDQVHAATAALRERYRLAGELRRRSEQPPDGA
jgi:hypothetical protein